MNARRTIAVLFVLLTAASLVPTATGVVFHSPAASAGVSSQQGARNATTNASITITNQTRNGRSVFVESVTLPEEGFVVLSEPGPNGSVVGVSLPLDPGTHEGKITFRGVPGSDLNRTRLGANTTLVATVHRDSNDNSRFDGLLAPGTDGAYTENGTPVRDRARLTVPEEERPTTASVNLTNGTSRGTNVTVDSVTLPDGGYVGIHRGRYNGSNATNTLIGATGYLAPGHYENVTVETSRNVSGQNVSGFTESGRVIAVVYEDTDGNHQFQYASSGGIEDRPALVNRTPVVASAHLTVTRPRTTTPTTTPTANATPTSTPTPTATAEPQTATPDPATPYGGETKSREGILENPLFPVLIVVFAIFVVLAAIGG